MSSAKRRGLPTAVKMKHDAHFVEELAARHTDAIGRKIPIARLRPNPDQPRQDFGELDELVASIRQVGVLEPLLVRADDDEGFMIVSGERRYRAAREAGLEEVPCIVLEVDDAEVLEIALIENLQRQDLSPFEEAEGLQALIDRFGYTHEEVAERIGKSRTTVTEALSLCDIPKGLRARLEEAGTRTKSILLEVARHPSEDMPELAELVIREGLTRDQVREYRRHVPDAAASSHAPDVAATPPPASDRPQPGSSTPSGGASSRSGPPAPPRRLTYRADSGVTVTLYLSQPDLTIDDVESALRDAIHHVRDTGIDD